MTTARIDDAQIAEAAFYIWLEEGCPEGREMDHWLRPQVVAIRRTVEPLDLL